MASVRLSKEFQAEDADIILRSADSCPTYERFKQPTHAPSSAYTVFQPVRLFRVHTAILGTYPHFAEPLKKGLSESKEPHIGDIPLIKVSEGKLILEHLLRFMYGNVDNQSDWYTIGAPEFVQIWQTAYQYKLSVLQAVAESFLIIRLSTLPTKELAELFVSAFQRNRGPLSAATREELTNRDALTWPNEALEVLSSKELLALGKLYHDKIRAKTQPLVEQLEDIVAAKAQADELRLVLHTPAKMLLARGKGRGPPAQDAKPTNEAEGVEEDGDAEA